MAKKKLVSPDIEAFYDKASEEQRLESGMGIFEFERIKSLIQKYTPDTPAKVVDVGGGTGKYSEWLAQQGHDVFMIEPVHKHIRIAEKRSNKLKNKFKVILGEAKSLEISSDFADIVILHGPLYHLQKSEDRHLAIQEAKRVTKPGGIILGFAINYTASTFVGLLQGLLHKKSFFTMCKEELTTGIHNPPQDFPWLLPEGYYHKPEELKQEFIDQDLNYINTYAIEGIGWLDQNYFTNMFDPKKKVMLDELTTITENDPNLLAMSPHMMIAVKK